MKNKRTKTVIIVVGIIIIFALLAVGAMFLGRVKMNPEGTIGNTGGNLNNSGLFCEYNGTVYFSNSFDNGALYAMNPDETEIRQLNDLKVQNILAGGDYLYYFQMGSAESSDINSTISTKYFSRSDLNGKNALGLTRDIVITAQLVDNYLYMLTSTDDGPSFYKMKIDKSDIVTLANYAINPSCAENGAIYYSNTQDNNSLYRLDASTDATYEMWQKNIWYPILYGDYVYYLDVSENYRLCRYSMSQDIIEVLTDDRVDCFNIGNGYIYYQKNGDTPQLKCMQTDGTDAKVIAEGNFTNINMTSQYVYFQDFGNENSLYHSYIGSDGYDQFIVQE